MQQRSLEVIDESMLQGLDLRAGPDVGRSFGKGEGFDDV